MPFQYIALKIKEGRDKDAKNQKERTWMKKDAGIPIVNYLKHVKLKIQILP